MYWYESRARTNLGGPDSVPAGCAVYSYEAGSDKRCPELSYRSNLDRRTYEPEDTGIFKLFDIFGFTRAQIVRDYTAEDEQPAAAPPLPPPVLQASQRRKLKQGVGDTCIQSLQGENLRNILLQRAAAPRYRRRTPDDRYRDNIGTTS